MKKSKKKSSKIPTLLICIFTFLTAVVTLVSKIYDRKQIIKAIDNDKEIKVLYK